LREDERAELLAEQCGNRLSINASYQPASVSRKPLRKAWFTLRSNTKTKKTKQFFTRWQRRMMSESIFHQEMAVWLVENGFAG